MSNVIPVFNNGSFDPEHVKTMGDAYDLIIRTFPADEHNAVALAILGAAHAGERDRDRLCDLALQSLSAEENLPHRRKET